MEVGFFFWPYDPDLTVRMAQSADRYGYDMIGVADTPGNAMDPWVAMTLVSQLTKHARVALCVTNLASRHPAISAAAIASIDLLAPNRAILGIGAGHSGTINLGIHSSKAADLEEGARYIQCLLSGARASYKDGGDAYIPWVRHRPKVFLAGSGPRALATAGRIADGVFINYGIKSENISQSQSTVVEAATAAGRDPSAVELWQIAALDCAEDGAIARKSIGAILAFMAAGYILGKGDLKKRGVPDSLHDAIRELQRRYSTRPGSADAELVSDLGLFDYLAERFAVYGDPEQCRQQILRAKASGLKRVMFTVSVASDPLRTVQLFGEKVLPAIRE